ncbi:dimethyl sulfoxide reductase anchor subunit family protein, partial [Burkholderia pseudomallei]
MKPAFSVIFLTTLSGASQGLMIALFGVELAARLGWIASPPQAFFVASAALAVLLGSLGLFASFFHLGRPERAWRAVAMWRTSWLARECIALPCFLACTTAYGGAHWLALPHTLALGLLAALASGALFVCTGMIYICLRFLQEWATPLTMTNFVLLGCASGGTLATAGAAWFAPPLVPALAAC